jgi:hypothetical protein
MSKLKAWHHAKTLLTIAIMISHIPIDYVSCKSSKSQTQVFCLIFTSVACVVGPSVNPLQNRETQHVNIVLQCRYSNIQIWKESMLELNGKPSSVTKISTDFSFQNLVFWNLFQFTAAEITFKSISPTF